MKQTAVDWLIEKVNGQSTGLGMYGMNVRIDIPADVIQQAKEMEKEQMIDAWSNGWLNDYQSDEDVKNSAEHYYNETFNTSEK
jgi:hypothetical protein